MLLYCILDKPVRFHMTLLYKCAAAD